jgi:ribosome-associated protein
MTVFKLEDKEFIELNKLLKLLGLVYTGGEANIRITEGEVLVNNQYETQKRKKLRVGDKIKFNNQEIIIE